MKKLLIFLFLFILAQPALFSQTTWKIPNYKPEPIRKVLVLAKISEMPARQKLEDFTVKFLSDKGIKAVAAYASLKNTRFETREEFVAYADSLGVDAVLSYTLEDAEKVVENRPTVSVGVGVGMYGGYMGASAPIAGGATMVLMVSVSGKFYTRAATGEQWIIKLSGKYDGTPDKLAYNFAKTTAKAMVKEGLFLPQK